MSGITKKRRNATYCPLVKVKVPRSMDTPKSELQIIDDSEHRLLGVGMYAYTENNECEHKSVKADNNFTHPRRHRSCAT